MEVLNVFDNEGFTLDRYTINVVDEYGNAYLITCSGNPTHPLGVWSVDEGTYILPEDVEEDDKNIGKEIDWLVLPETVRKTVESYFED